MTLRVTGVAVSPAPPSERGSGLLAWLTVEVNGLALDGFTLRKTQKRRPYIGFPKRRDNAGRLHPQVWSSDHRIRQSLVDQILVLVAADFEELAT